MTEPWKWLRLKSLVKRVPVIGSVALVINRRARNWAAWSSYSGSLAHWRAKYDQGGGPGWGSYGQLAGFKAEIINRFVSEQRIQSVIEFGCGDGNQLELASYPAYIGLDVASVAVARCSERFAGDNTKSFFLYDPNFFVDNAGIFRAELALSLDVIFHLVEDELFELHMRHLFGAAERFVIVYSSNRDERTAEPGIRHRKWTNWVAMNTVDWKLRESIPNRYPYVGDARSGSHSDFYFYER
jgi:hypothetical protein